MSLMYVVLILPSFVGPVRDHYLEDLCRTMLYFEGIDTKDLYEST